MDKHIVLINGQSNANAALQNGISAALQQNGTDAEVVLYSQPGSPIKYWIKDGPAKHNFYNLMWQKFNTEIQAVLAAGDTVASVTLVYFQGESDFGFPLSNPAVPADFAGRFNFFMSTFLSEAQAAWGVLPHVIAVEPWIDASHPVAVANPQLVAGYTTVNNAIQAGLPASGKYVLTGDLDHNDYLHLTASAQVVLADRIIANMSTGQDVHVHLLQGQRLIVTHD